MEIVRNYSSSRKKHLIFTIVGKNYIGQALILGKSLIKTNPEVMFYIVVADCLRHEFDNLASSIPELKKATENFKFVCINEIGLKSYRQMSLRYDAVEFCTAIKPASFLHFARFFTSFVISYFDPDIKVYTRLSTLEDNLNLSQMVVMPHINTPFLDDLQPTLGVIQKAGVFNFGYLGINPGFSEVIELMTWWRDQLEYFCLNDVQNGIFVDQKWGNLFPCFLSSICIFRDDGHDVAYWNLHERLLTKKDSGYFANDVRLSFFHFSGYSLQRPDQLSTHQNRIILKASPILNEIVEDYKNEMISERVTFFKSLGFGWDQKFPNAAVTNSIRTWYRGLGREATIYGFDPYTNLHLQARVAEIYTEKERIRAAEKEAEEREAKLAAASAGLDEEQMLAVQEKPHRLRIIMHEQYTMLYPIYRAIRAWFGYNRRLIRHTLSFQANSENELSSGDSKKEVQSLFIRDFKKSDIKKIDHKKIETRETRDVNIFGYLTSELGVGESCRGLVDTIDKTNYSTGLYDLASPSRKQDLRFAERIKESNFNAKMSIVHVNADQVRPFFQSDFGSLSSHSQRKVGYWYWELDQFPDQWAYLEMYFDEIWVATSFIQESVSKKLRIPIHIIPPAVCLPEISNPGKAHFNIDPHTSMVLMVFDGFSYVERKNPFAVVKAFRLLQERMQNENITLVIKAINLSAEQELLLNVEASGLKVHIINKYLTREETLQLMAVSDCYISLHRSEGLGLTLLEAMSLGVPVVATGYSGNMDFMTNDNSYPVNYTLIPIGADHGPYRANYIWADPDIHHAAAQLEKVLLASPEVAQKAKMGVKTLQDNYSPAALSRKMEPRIQQLISGSVYTGISGSDLRFQSDRASIYS